MADIKISDLTAATTPLGGTEVLPIVQSGVTVKVAVSNLTAGRSVSATSVAITGSTSGTATITVPAVAGTPTITLPIVTGTLATLAGTETLTNKTLTGAVMNGTVGATTPSTGAFTTGTFSSTLGVTGATTLSAALTYGGVTLSNAVTGTGNMVLSASPSFTTLMNVPGGGTVGGSISNLKAVTSSNSGNTSGLPIHQWYDTVRVVMTVFNQTGADGTAANAADTILKLLRDGGTLRSINAAGTINASGTDYAEYERKSTGCGLVAKGDIVGFDAEGLITDKFSESFSFGIKSTNPGYIGGDAWGRPKDICPIDGQQIGKKPTPLIDNPGELLDETKADEHAKKLAAYETSEIAYEIAMEAWSLRHEAARALVDRIAYSGKAPVNIIGAKSGQWIVPTLGDNDSILGIVSDKWHQDAVGRVRKILSDGRAEVKVV